MTANAGSIKIAAEQLFISPSTLSDQIKVLENRLGQVLFKKGGKLFKLTTKGSSLYQLVDPFFSTFSSEADILFSEENNKKIISLGISSTISSELVNEIIKIIIFKEHIFPIIHTLSHDELYQRALDNDIDIIVSDDDNFPKTTALKFERYKLRKFCAVYNGTPHTMNKSFPNLLNETNFISYSKAHFLHQKTLQYFQEHEINPNVVCEIDNINLMLKLTLDGLGASILPHLAVKNHIDNNNLNLLGEIPSFSPFLCIGFSQRTFDSQFMDYAFENIKHAQLN